MDEYRFEIHRPDKRGEYVMSEDNIVVYADDEGEANEKAKTFTRSKYGNDSYGSNGWKIIRLRLVKLANNPDNEI